MVDDDRSRQFGPLTPLSTSNPELAAIIELRLDLPIRNGDDVVELMTRVAGLAVQHVAGADHAGITAVLDPLQPFTVGPTDPLVGVFDRSQYRLGDGPCLLAARSDAVVEFDLARLDLRWPDLGAAARECGIVCIVAAPLHRGSTSVGSLNLYSDIGVRRTPSATSAVLVVLLAHLDRGLGAFGVHLSATEHAQALQSSVESRSTIAHALGVIAELTHGTHRAAVDLLEAKARTEGSSVRTAAERVVEHRAL